MKNGIMGRCVRLLLAISASIVLCFDLPLAIGCFSVIVGSDASANGHVMLAHTEDFTPSQNINLLKVARDQPYPGEIAVPKISDSPDSHWALILLLNRWKSHLME